MPTKIDDLHKELASLVRRMSYALKRAGNHDSLVISSVGFLKRFNLGGETIRAMSHANDDHEDQSERDVCSGIYSDRCDDNLALCTALRAVLALAGENEQIRTVIETAIEDHGI